MFVVHPKVPQDLPVERDFAIILHEWAVHPGTYRPDPSIMLDFNMYTLPMMMGIGPYGDVEMGGMFTVVKVRDGIETYEDPGWYQQPEGSAAYRVS